MIWRKKTPDMNIEKVRDMYIPLFQLYGFSLRLGWVEFWGKNGPSSSAAPNPTDEHPGPIYIFTIPSQYTIN